MPSMITNAFLFILVFIGASLYGPIKRSGIFRGITKINVEGSKTIPLVQCEDLHVHNGLVYTACQHSDRAQDRTKWFPPMGIFDVPVESKNEKRGDLYVIDPQTTLYQKLKVSNFDVIDFHTHGIGLYPDAENLFIFAVNHLPNPDHIKDPQSPAARSQIEIFKVSLPVDGSLPTTATHVKSVLHPAIRTPNDILPTGPSSFYVTNDHFYRDGFMRVLEDVSGPNYGRWSDSVHVDASGTKTVAHQVVSGLHNNNGIMRGMDNEVIIMSAAGGTMYRLKDDPVSKNLTLIKDVSLDSSLDNPFYFSEGSEEQNAYYLAGYPKILSLLNGHKDLNVPIDSIVWRLKKRNDGTFTKEIVFMDDGTSQSSASSAVVVPLKSDPNRGLLLVSGPWSHHITVTEINL
ncbi:hypothetical protein AKO1_011160 [Acrasis kona]|uniref:Serum paraoxonase/arylesterase n=1 Tax=Acrasis kona TaxID=1008807 RepID=A0AAW2Z034_9EUKA